MLHIISLVGDESKSLNYKLSFAGPGVNKLSLQVGENPVFIVTLVCCPVYSGRRNP